MEDSKGKMTFPSSLEKAIGDTISDSDVVKNVKPSEAPYIYKVEDKKVKSYFIRVLEKKTFFYFSEDTTFSQEQGTPLSFLKDKIYCIEDFNKENTKDFDLQKVLSNFELLNKEKHETNVVRIVKSTNYSRNEDNTYILYKCLDKEQEEKKLLTFTFKNNDSSSVYDSCNIM
jgi:hypothetical protein